jgi:uncharacterized membrane protein
MDKPDLDELAIDCLRRTGPINARELFAKLRDIRPGLQQQDFVNLIDRLKMKEVVITDDFANFGSFLSYLQQWELSIWFYLSSGLAVLILALFYVENATFPLILMRWIGGSIFLTILPGFTLFQTLFPDESKHNILTRLALSVGLSLAVDSFIGLLLALSTGLTTISVIFSVAAFVISIGAIGLYRQYRTRKHRA